MHFSASSQWSKICFGYQGIIFNGKKGLKFSQIEVVRLRGSDPPTTPKAVSLTAFSQFFFEPFPNTYTVLNFIQTSKTSRLITFNWSLSSWWNRCRSQNHSSYWTALIMFHTEGHNCDDNHEEVDDKRADHHCSYPINRTSLKDLGADVLVCSAYKFFGPHLGLMAFNKERLRSLQPSKVFD